MIKKILTLSLILSVFLILGCDLFGSQDVEYGTPDAALTESFSVVTSLAGSAGSETEPDGDGNLSYSEPGLTITGSYSEDVNGAITTITSNTTSTFSNYSNTEYPTIILSGTFTQKMTMVMDLEAETGSASGTFNADITVTGSDISKVKMDVTMNADMVTRETVFTGDIIIDGTYYHAADLLGFDEEG